jgi:hypothetical protein
LLTAGVPRVRPAVAAVRAALWAASDRQAALILTMVVQQRLVTVAALTEAASTVRRHRRRKFLLRLLVDLQGGIQSMAELDFARMCRTSGLPEPDQNELTTARSAVLRIPVLGLRTDPTRFLRQVRAALITRGWRPH